MRCVRCGRDTTGEAVRFGPPLDGQGLAKCLACGPWTDAERRAVAIEQLRRLAARRGGCGCNQQAGRHAGRR